jgi:hypothetical protein
MNFIARMLASREIAEAERRAAEARARLAATLKPCPEIRERRLRQMGPERRARAERNAREIADLIGGAL